MAFSFGGASQPAAPAFSFGGGAPAASPFGAPPASSAPAAGGGLFGGAPAPAPSPFGGGGGAFGFGAPAASAAPGGGGLFGGAPAASQPAAGGGLFGAAPAAPAGGLFGAAPGGGLFGAAPASSAPAAGGGLFGAPQPATGGGLFGAPAPAAGGGLFGAPAPAGGLFGAPAAAAPAPSAAAAALTTRDGRPAVHSTRWDELSEAGQKYLLDLERLVAQAREESRQLEDDAALHDAAARAAAPSTGRRALAAALARVAAASRADGAAADALREDVMTVLRGAEAAVRAFERGRAWRDAARGGVAALPPAARDALTAPAELPSRYLRAAVARLTSDAAAAAPLAADLERLLPTDAGGAGGGALAPPPPPGGLPAALGAAHDALLGVAARIDRLHARVDAARAAHVAGLRAAGDVRDPDEELVAFFEGHDLDDACPVYVCRRSGRATGEAYAAFATPAAAAAALSAKDRGVLGTRYVELFPEPLADPAAPPTGRPLAGGLAARVVRLRGLPFTATPDDVVSFLAGVGAPPPRCGGAGVVFTATPDGRPTGEAYIEFDDDAAADAALAAHGRPLGPRYVEAFGACRGEMLHAARARGVCPPPPVGGEGRPQPVAKPPPPPPRDPAILRLRGLPYDATASEVADFFEGFDLAPLPDAPAAAPSPRAAAVHIVPRVALTLTATGAAVGPAADGEAPRGSGVAFVRFASADEAARARAAKHRATLGTRYVELLPSVPPRGRGVPAILGGWPHAYLLQPGPGGLAPPPPGAWPPGAAPGLGGLPAGAAPRTGSPPAPAWPQYPPPPGQGRGPYQQHQARPPRGGYNQRDGNSAL